ncbi:archaellin/type IV pilin N-terminal domain-containing protein [Methanoculleus bourgensis]|uniref:archaellin/type IV pilin N-terminal domain-containing protein n=1 Tax=Methanoculleus bourgensis TaxID=83986 RepID=UPI0022ED65A9|nr:archaellin/type IV pilin N-terminal domain-containing protein [Methanoculleus bourgensis]GLI46163.1 flagellin [Methanoculleus bourgensis]
MSKLVKNEDAFTGLEAAIVLIAFIVVAAVFSYVMLGAGFFATGEAQRVVGTGVAQASSNLELSGPVIVTAADGNMVGKINFILQLAAGGASVDMQKVTFTVATAEAVETYTYDQVDPKWYAKGVEQQGDQNDMLDKFEMVMITIPGEGETPDLPTIGSNERFTVEVKPDIGAALPINRIAPPDLLAKHNYEVY